MFTAMKDGEVFSVGWDRDLVGVEVKAVLCFLDTNFSSEFWKIGMHVHRTLDDRKTVEEIG